ncbi:MAG TPA: transposase [Ktedonobacteraceae bacterium]|jgi:hypothetical protein
MARPKLLWGYGSGVAAATPPDYGDIVLAEYTLPFNEGDVRSFRPLHQQTVLALSGFPTHLSADAAFDAWYVYDAAALHGGIAAVPKVAHGQTVFDADAVPRCALGLRMVAADRFAHGRSSPAQRYRCPLLYPQPTGAPCAHEQFAKGAGCVKLVNISAGGLQRLTLDRTSPLSKSIYPQRTSCERINSQAKELGIERPRVRNGRSVANLNTLISVVLNVRALQRAQSINAGLLSTGKGF